jgi:hypothetical protein
MSLMRLVAPRERRAYAVGMASAVLRLIALIALVLMPLSMASAPASAHPNATASAGHCDDHQQPAKAPSGPQMHCTACAALPAMDAPVPIAELAPEMPLIIAFSTFLPGIEPDTATPPPKLV